MSRATSLAPPPALIFAITAAFSSCGGPRHQSRRPGPGTVETPPEISPSRAGIEWVSLPGGAFDMGSQEPGPYSSLPIHRVALKPYQLAKSPVTFRQYRLCVEARVCAPAHADDSQCWILQDGRWGLGPLPAEFRGDDQPTVCVTWEQARVFSQWVGGRLPSEAEWEYAATSAGARHAPIPSCAIGPPSMLMSPERIYFKGGCY